MNTKLLRMTVAIYGTLAAWHTSVYCAITTTFVFKGVVKVNMYMHTDVSSSGVLCIMQQYSEISFMLCTPWYRIKPNEYLHLS